MLFLGLAADFRLQLIDSAAKVECPEYAALQLKPVSVEIQVNICHLY